MSQACATWAGNDLCKLFEGPTEDNLDAHARQMLVKSRDFFKEVDRLLKSISLYGLQHPAINQLKMRAFDVLTELLELQEEVGFEVGPYDFLLYDQSIYEDVGVESSFVYKFYLDGIRRISIRRGVTVDEMRRLLGVVLSDWHDPALFEDDAVTLFWTQAFEHIHYTVMESFQDNIKESEARAHSVVGIIESVRRGGQIYARRPIFRDAHLALEASDLAQFQENPFALDEISLVRLASLIRTYDRETLEKFIEILFRATLQGMGSHEERQDRVVGLFDRIARLLLSSGRIDELERLLRKIRLLKGPDGVSLPINVAVIEKILGMWSDREFIETLLAYFDAPDCPFWASVLEICKLLNAEAAYKIVDCADRIQNAAYRKSLLDWLPERLIGQELRVAPLLKMVSEDVAHMLLHVILRPPWLFQTAQLAMESRFDSVRYAGISALADCREPGFDALILSALKDDARKVRGKALQILMKNPQSSLSGYLMESIDKKSFDSAPLEEKRRFFLAAERCGAPDDWLLKQFHTHSLLRRSALAERRHCAAIALAVREHPQAKALFDACIQGLFQPKIVVEACVWGVTYLACEPSERERQRQAFFFSSEEKAS